MTKDPQNNNAQREKIKEQTNRQWTWFQMKIKALRKAKGLTQTELAEKLGVQKARVCHMELIETDCTFSMAMRLISAFDLNPREFFDDCPNFIRVD